MNDDWRSRGHVVYRLHAHLGLTPKYRRKVITDRVGAELRSSFKEVCDRYQATLDDFETDADHTHLLVCYPPKVALATLVMSLKTISSHRVRQHRWPQVQKALWGKRFWSPSYAVISRGDAPLEHVKEYIRGQHTPPHQTKKNRQHRAP